MAKTRRRKSYAGVRKLYRRAKSSAKSGLATAGRYVVGGVVYSVAMMASSFIPVGLDARLKRLLIIGLMWLMGGVFRNAAYVGLAVETVAFVSPYISQMAGGITQTASAGGF